MSVGSRCQVSSLRVEVGLDLLLILLAEGVLALNRLLDLCVHEVFLVAREAPGVTVVLEGQLVDRFSAEFAGDSCFDQAVG